MQEGVRKNLPDLTPEKIYGRKTQKPLDVKLSKATQGHLYNKSSREEDEQSPDHRTHSRLRKTYTCHL
jgi:hypothetical protein